MHKNVYSCLTKFKWVLTGIVALGIFNYFAQVSVVSRCASDDTGHAGAGSSQRLWMLSGGSVEDGAMYPG